MNDIITDMTRVMDLMMVPLGECAPVRRRLLVDYRSGGTDYHQELVAFHDRRATDAALVESVRASLSGMDCAVMAVAEVTDSGVRVLYLEPGYLEEVIREISKPGGELIPAGTGKENDQ